MMALELDQAEIESVYWRSKGFTVSSPFTAHPPRIIGRCNDLARGRYWSRDAAAYMDYKTWLKINLAIPEELALSADGVLIDLVWGLPKSCLRKNGEPTKNGLERLNGVVKSLPIDWDNAAKPVADAVFKTGSGTIKDADLMLGQVSKRWGLETSVTVRLLLPLSN